MLLILKHWRLIAACAAIGAAFYAGWSIQGWKKDAALKAAHEAQSAALAELIQRRNEQRQAEIEAEAIRRQTFERQRAADQALIAQLREDIAHARLSVPESRAAAEVDAEGNYSCPAPLGSVDFVRLWNEAARRNH